MSNTLFTRKKLRAGTALQALALLGAGVVASAAFVAPASAQDFTNVNATGRVQGTNGQPVAGATVTITSNSQGFSRTATTSGDGSYRVNQLPIGRYTYTVSADGYDTYTDDTVVLTQSSTGNVFTLASTGATAAGDIVVTAGRTKVADFEQTTTGGSINVGDLANRVPVARDLTSIVRLTPGAAQGDSAFGNLPSISGASVGENQYYVNGLNITNFRTFLGSNRVPFEFYDTVDVKDGGYQAEFGRATGGVVSATTKSGSNTFHTGVIVTYEPNGLRSTSPNTIASDNDADYSSSLLTDVYVSGPIIKDHLFFYALAEARDNKTGAGSNTSLQYSTGRSRSPFFAGKIDAVIVDGQRLEFTYFTTKGTTLYDANTYDPNTNHKGAYIGSQTNAFGGNNFVARYTGSFTNWFTLSAAYGKSKDRDNTFSTLPDQPLIADDRGDTTIYPAGSNPFYFQTFNEDDREFYRADADVYVKLFGSHHFRFGYDRENLKTTGLTDYTSGVYYNIYHGTTATYCGTPVPAAGCSYIRARRFENGGSFNTYNEAFYAEDSWSLFNDRLTLQLGIRDDRFKNNNIDDVTYYKSGDQWGPRINFAYDVFGNKRTKFYGSFGRYFLPIAANTNIRLGGAEYDVYSYYRFNDQYDASGKPILGLPVTKAACPRPDPVYGNVNNCFVGHDGSVADTTTTVAHNLKPQSEDEYILGLEQKVGQHWTFGVYGTYRKLNTALEDAAIDGAARRYCRDQGYSASDCSSLFGGFSQYVLINPGSDANVTLYGIPDGKGGFTFPGPTITLTKDQLGYPKASRKYEGITFKFDREFDGVWSLSGSYTYSKTLGNYEGAVTSDNGQTDAGLTQDFDQPELTYGAYGYSPNDHRHNFKVYGSYQLTDWLMVGANVDVQSPRHYGCFGTFPAGLTEISDTINAYYGAASHYCPYKNGQVSDSNPVVLVPRGTAFQSDWLTSVDLSAAIKLPTDAFDGQLRLNVYNVFNSKAVTDLNEFGTYDDGSARGDYRAPTSYQQPRYAQVQLMLRF